MWIVYCWDFKATVSSVSSSFDSIHFDEVVSFTLSLRSDLSWSNQIILIINRSWYWIWLCWKQNHSVLVSIFPVIHCVIIATRIWISKKTVTLLLSLSKQRGRTTLLISKFLKEIGSHKPQAAKSQETTCAISYDFADWVSHHWGHCSSAQIKQQVSQPTSLTPDLR